MVREKTLRGKMALSNRSDPKSDKPITVKKVGYKSTRKVEKSIRNFHKIAIIPVVITSSTTEKVCGSESNTGSKDERDRRH